MRDAVQAVIDRSREPGCDWTHVQFRMLVNLAEHLNGETGRLDPSLKRLAAECHTGKGAVRRTLDQLEAKQVIRRRSSSKGGSGHRQSYELPWFQRVSPRDPLGAERVSPGTRKGLVVRPEPMKEPGKNPRAPARPLTRPARATATAGRGPSLSASTAGCSPASWSTTRGPSTTPWAYASPMADGSRTTLRPGRGSRHRQSKSALKEGRHRDHPHAPTHPLRCLRQGAGRPHRAARTAHQSWPGRARAGPARRAPAPGRVAVRVREEINMSKAWQGGTRAWRAIKGKVLKPAGYRCQVEHDHCDRRTGRDPQLS